jgi:phospholipase/lecithinase/hemolysin
LHLDALEDRTVPSGGLVGNLVVFGDSLSDTGNFIPNIPPGSLPPPIAQSMALYYQGRMSDGPIWVDTLAKYLGEPPVQPSSVGGLNYAVSGANLLYPGPKFPFNVIDAKYQTNLSAQVNNYLADHEPAASDLFVVYAGAKDLFDSLSDPHPPGTPPPIIDAQQVADQLVRSLETLAGNGAQRFLVPNLPALGETPIIRSLGDLPRFAADQWTDTFDTALAADLAAFESEHTDATVVSVDTAGLFQQITRPDNPFGFVDWQHAVGPLIPGTFFLNNPTPEDLQKAQSYFFFDGVHPTSKGHQLFGLATAAAVYDALGVHDLVVTSTADTVDPTASGLSLREMVNLSNMMHGQQAITFDLGHGRHEIDLSGKELSITQDLTIRGAADDNHDEHDHEDHGDHHRITVSGNDASRVFDISTGTTVTIEGLTITHGLADLHAPDLPGIGGGILNHGNLTLTDDVVSDNRAVGDKSVMNVPVGGYVVTGGGAGGGVFNLGTLRVTGSTFSTNQAVGVMAASARTSPSPVP